MRRLLSDVSAIPPGAWTFMGAVIGFSAVAWQTRRGFKNLIASQEHRGELDRVARADQARLVEEGKLADQNREAKVIAAAIHAELIGLLAAVHNSTTFL